jgi:tetratricopeptide (TPR) repeat protein
VRALVALMVLTAAPGGDLVRALLADPFAKAPFAALLHEAASAEGKAAKAAELRRAGGFAGYLVAARIEVEAGHLPQARADVRSALPALPEDLRTLDAFARFAATLGSLPEAAQAAQRAAQRAPSARRLVTLAQAELRLGKSREAFAHVAEARRLDPGAEEPLLEMADTLIAERLYAEAATLLGELAGHSRGAASVSLWRKLGEAYERAGDWRHAGPCLLHALDTEPSVAGRRAIAKSILLLYRQHGAERQLVDDLGEPRSLSRLVLLGDVLAKADPARALKVYQAAARLAPSDPEPLLRLANLPGLSMDERIGQYRQLAAAHPQDLQFTLGLADLYAKAQQLPQAQTALEAAAAQLARSPDAQAKLAEWLAAHGLVEPATSCWRRAVALDATNASYALWLGQALARLDRQEAAIAALREFLRRSGGGREAYDELIATSQRAGNTAATRLFYAEAVERWPADLELRRGFAGWLESQQNPKQALSAWQEVERRCTRPFERDQARFHIKRLEDHLQIAGGR